MITGVIQSASAYLPELNVERLKSAFEFAKKAHEGQLRKDGSPYIIHPVSAAEILTTLHVDEDTLIACFLHDVPEDTEVTLEDIEEKFGKTVSFLVEGITKLSKVHYRNDMEERQIESLKKLFLHTAKDPRIILIKLADRLHNMSTIDAIPNKEKRERIAKETLEIYVPIANLFGIWELKSRLEDFCFHVIRPEEFAEIDALVQQSSFKKQSLLEQSIGAVEKLLKEKNISFTSIEGRRKNHYGIYRKMKNKNKSFHDIFDIVGLRVIVDDIGACYQSLGVIHQAFTPKIGRLKDYIAIPKSNGYQSIHTTVFGLDGAPTEIQIRTYDMHLENEYGIAAHYFYRNSKNKQNKVKQTIENKYSWIQDILNLQKDIKSNAAFMKNLKLDIFKDRIFVFTPRGDVVDLPKGSSVIDFAYHVHTEVGLLAESASINSERDLSLMTKLKNGDTIKVNTSEKAAGPQVEWLNHVQSNVARNCIRAYLKEKDRHLLIDSAEQFFDRTLKIFGIKGIFGLSQDQKLILLSRTKMENWDELMLELGNGNLDVQELVHQLYAQPMSQSTQIGLALLVENRVGLLRDITIILVDLGVNIEHIHTFDTKDISSTGVELTLNFESMEQYEKTVYTLWIVDGVYSVTRLDNDESLIQDPVGAHKVHGQ